MSWEKRNGRRYYYHKLRIGKTVRSMYIGSGVIAKQYEELIMLRKKALVNQRNQLIELEHNLSVQKYLLDEACGQIKDFTSAFLLAAGFHQHKRQWRNTYEKR